ncbi:MAG: phosphoglycerate kinase [Phoenicibacter congonensis]|uniref:Phosphoglycerate kinase n=1 Tax=Phoenicibacter congonensis TaxID=1944646 RepID=A0AA43RGJ3_9ACTN|nr:phosphoglycerate kinase [Phoenicibacter congonensis]
MKTIDAENFKGKRVIVRVDFNVPMKDGVVTDDTRIRKAIPTIKKLVEDGARVILMSHLGRPSGNGFEQDYSLEAAAVKLSNLIGRPVLYSNEIAGEGTIDKIAGMNDGDILVIENLRFDAREKKNDEAFASELASLADAYVNDAFGTAHRAHASTAGIARYLPAYAGYLLENEVKTITGMLDNPKKPFVAVLGGSKVSDKIKVIENLLDKADTIVIGGAMCFTFLKAQGAEIGSSLVEEDWVERCKEMLAKAKEIDTTLLLPVDVVCAEKIEAGVPVKVCNAFAIDSNLMGLDIGPKSIENYKKAIAEAKSVFWNGPMGVFEIDEFAAGTKAVAEALAENEEAETIIGGGDSVAAVNKFGLADKMTFISTGGGASMELVQGDVLPGVAALG